MTRALGRARSSHSSRHLHPRRGRIPRRPRPLRHRPQLHPPQFSLAESSVISTGGPHGPKRRNADSLPRMLATSSEAPQLSLTAARHPLLELRMSAEAHEEGSEARSPATPVPLTIVLAPETKQLIISGPNTGGKTVSLKTLGLLASWRRPASPSPPKKPTSPSSPASTPTSATRNPSSATSPASPRTSSTSTASPAKPPPPRSCCSTSWAPPPIPKKAQPSP